LVNFVKKAKPQAHHLPNQSTQQKCLQKGLRPTFSPKKSGEKVGRKVYLLLLKY
jgi:hypothetical protein